MTTHWQTAAAKSLFSEVNETDCDAGIGLCVTWQDAMDPNSSDKSSCGSAHVDTFTSLAESNQNDPMLSFITSMSCDKKDQEDVCCTINADVEKMGKPTDHCDGENTKKSCFLRVADPADQPECSTMTGIGAHNGKHTMWFDHLCPADDELMSCKKCLIEH